MFAGPSGPANILFVQYKDVGQWYKVETIGDTCSGDCDDLGALLGLEPFPVVGRVFKAKQSSLDGERIVSSLI